MCLCIPYDCDPQALGIHYSLFLFYLFLKLFIDAICIQGRRLASAQETFLILHRRHLELRRHS